MDKCLRSVFLFFVLVTNTEIIAQVVINEIQSVNKSTLPDYQEEYSDWIELYNLGTTTINLNGYGLSDDEETPFQWVFTDLTLEPHQFLIVFASSKNTIVGDEIHTNFKLSSSGENVFLTSPSGELLDKSPLSLLAEDQSYGRLLDGGSDWGVFSTSSPGVSNQSGIIAQEKLNRSLVNLKAGFYTQQLSIELSCPDAGATAYYSIDGNSPSLTYAQPLLLSKSTVVKSECRESGKQASDVKTNSYFIGTDHKIPVVSLSFKPDDFYGIDSGIYVLGDNYEFNAPNYGANFWEDWERKVHFEYFVDGDEKVEQDLGVKIFGGWSRASAMKGLRLISRSEYGKGSIDYPFFSEKPYLDKFDQLILRNGGNDFNGTMWSDAHNHRALGPVSNVDLMGYQPVAIYFNGEYKGLQNLRERPNEAYFESNHDFSSSSFDFLEFNGGIYLPNQVLNNGTLEGQVKEGTNTGFVALYELITQNDMSIDNNYKQVVDQLDIPDFIDYFAAQIYHINNDWPHNNIRFWRSPDYDGKWHYIYYDTEFGKGMYGGANTRASFDELNRVINDNRNVHSMMFKSLLTNDRFKFDFINRSADLMNTIYTPTNYKSIAEEIEVVISEEVNRHFTLYGACCHQDKVNEVYDFIDSRPSYARGDYTSQFGFAQNNVILTVLPEGAGVIKISTIIPENYPWTGAYYNDVPVVITAIPNSGYTFSGWSGVDASTLRDTVILSGTSTSITANFLTTTAFSDLKITEINYHSLDSEVTSGDWFEIYNNGNASEDLSGWVFRDAHVAHQFIFPEGTILTPGSYLVVAQDLSDFKDVFPTINNVVGDFEFGLGSGGDELFLTDTNGRLRLYLHYDDKTPWPTLADGKGATMELKSTQLDYQVTENWKGNCKNGSPGIENVNCDCQFTVDLGDDVIDCSKPLAINLSANIGASRRDFYWYENGDLVSTSPTYSVVEGGVYELVVIEGVCMSTDKLVIIDELEVDLGGGASLCSPSTYYLDADLHVNNVSYQWMLNDEVLSTESAIQVNIPGTYSVTLLANGCTPVSDEVLFKSNGPEVENVIFCKEDSVATVTISGDGEYEWFTAGVEGASLGTHNSLLFEKLVSDTIFYVQDNSFKEAVVGRASPVNSVYQVPSTEAMLFTVLNPMKLVAVSVQPQARFGNTSVVVRVLDELDELVKSVTVSLSGSALQRIVLDVELNPGNYKIDALGTSGGRMGGNLYYENAIGEFPYTAEDMLTITGNSDSTDAYYYFYNFEVEKGEQGCDRVPVYLTISDCLPTSVFELEDTPFEIYPNPASDWIRMSSNIEKITIFSMEGKLVLSSKLNEKEVNISALNNGLYFVELWGEGKLETKKIQVVR